MNVKKLGIWLVEIGYPGLFMHGGQSLADSIWENGKNKKQLEIIVLSTSSTWHAKFLAAEVLRHFDIETDSKGYPILAEAYAIALQNTSADRENIVQLNGNLWGLLYEEDDVGHLGRQFINFGDAAIPPLTKLLDDNANRIIYEGSEEAVTGSAYQYRIKDFAAFYISKIKNISIDFYQDLYKRDKEIERLKGILKVRN